MPKPSLFIAQDLPPELAQFCRHKTLVRLPFLVPPSAAPPLPAAAVLCTWQFMGELTAQVGISEFPNCKTWYENARVCGMTECHKRFVFVPVFAVGNPNLSG